MANRTSPLNTHRSKTERHAFEVPGLHCVDCAHQASLLLNSIPGVIHASMDHVMNIAEIEIVRGAVSVDALAAGLYAAGYASFTRMGVRDI